MAAIALPMQSRQVSQITNTRYLPLSTVVATCDAVKDKKKRSIAPSYITSRDGAKRKRSHPEIESGAAYNIELRFVALPK
jgi:hypothetical protein